MVVVYCTIWLQGEGWRKCLPVAEPVHSLCPMESQSAASRLASPAQNIRAFPPVSPSTPAPIWGMVTPPLSHHQRQILGYSVPQSPRGSALSTTASGRASPGVRHRELEAPGERARQGYKCYPFPKACASLCQNPCRSFLCVMHGLQLGFESTLPYMKRKRKI